MAYNALNELTSQTDPLNHTATFAYDANGNQTSTTDRDGRRRDMTYDALNRQTGQKWYDSSNTLQNTLSSLRNKGHPNP